MGNVLDKVLINDFSIPGTHDSGTYSFTQSLVVGTIGNLIAGQCQVLTFSAQLCAGIRFFDFRWKVYKNELVCYHGIITYRLKARDILKDAREFLKKKPNRIYIYGNTILG